MATGTARGGLRWWIATAVFTLLSNLTLLLATPSLSLLSMVVAFIPPRGDLVMPLARLWSRLYLWSSGVRIESSTESSTESPTGSSTESPTGSPTGSSTESPTGSSTESPTGSSTESPTGRDPGAGGRVYLANHQSMVDIAVLLVTIPGQLRFVAKRSLFRIPFFGWSLAAAGFVAVDRSDVRSARGSFRAATELLRSGRSIALFPEETRSTDGRLLPFKRGGVLLALRTGFPIVPVGIRGSRHVRPKGSWLSTPGTVRVRFGPAIEVAGGVGGRAELEARVRAEIERLVYTD